jgi:hypothetical protein
MKARLLRAVLFVVCFLICGSAFAAGVCPSGLPVIGSNCYFIAANGSDSNSGTSESTPWLHAPGMPNCTGVCATVKPSPGQGFIFRGGDTWHFGNGGLSPYTGGAWDVSVNWGTAGNNCQYEGSQTACIYYGVDLAWFSGSSWTRPILTGDNPPSTTLLSSCAHQIAATDQFGESNSMVALGPQTILDNFELTGMCSQNANSVSGTSDTYLVYHGTGIGGSGMSFLENVYIHGWSATTTAGTGSVNWAGTIISGTFNGLQTLDHIVIDGSDSNPGSWAWGTFPSFYHFRDSMIRYTGQGVGAWCHDIHDNVFEHQFNHNPGAGSHSNVLECNNDSTGDALNQPANTPNVFYNNIVRHDDSSYIGSGQVHLWFCPENGINEYWFNNLMYDVAFGNDWDYAGPPIYSCNSAGTGNQFMFNNTLVDVVQPCFVSNVSFGGAHLTVLNEHLINTPYDSGTTACTGHSDTTNIAQSDATAITQGYLVGSGGTANSDTCANDTSPCAPTSAGNSTVGTGANHQAYCTALAGFSSEFAIGTEAANACKFGTTDACTYNTSSHAMVCPAQTAVARPTSAAWDEGAYQYSASQSQAPQPPTNLLITVQ